MTLPFLAILVVVNSAIWTYFDASRLRDAHHTGVGPMGRPPQAWAVLTLFFWPVVFPLYLAKARDEAGGQPLRQGPPPLFDSSALNVWGYLSLAVFTGAAVAALLYFDRPRWALAALAAAAAGVFGGRSSVQSSREQRFDLGGAAWDMRAFRPVEEDGEESEGSMGEAGVWSGATDLPPVADRRGNFQSVRPRPPEAGGRRPNLPRDVFSAPGQEAEQAEGQPAQSPPAPSPPPSVPPAQGPPKQGRPRGQAIATDTRRLAEMARRLHAEAGEDEEWNPEEEEKDAAAVPPPPAPAPGASAPGASAPGASAPGASPATGRRPPRPTAPSSRPMSAAGGAPASGASGPEDDRGKGHGSPPGGGSYGGYAASSGRRGGVPAYAWWLAGLAVLCLVGWAWSAGILSGGGGDAVKETPVPAPVAASTETETTETETGSRPEARSEDPEARLQREMSEWIDEYDRLMQPIAKLTEDIDFEGFSRQRCSDLTRTVQLAKVTLREAPDPQVEKLLRPAFAYLEAAVRACDAEDANAWSYNLLRAKDHTHEAQVMMDERYRYAGFLELEQESAIGVTRPPSSMSGRYLEEQEGG